ncbi:MAG: DnaJ domain-containing protein [Candidatus Poribacteria bacterium]|nr:DnaJ domain-containing protein [Candidatus Poribacteria bacterium]
MTRTKALGILGLSSTATPNDIKKAFRNLAKITHPDKNNSPGAHQRFIDVKTAYGILSDPQAQREHAAREARERQEREAREKAERERKEREIKERLRAAANLVARLKRERQKRQAREWAERERQGRIAQVKDVETLLHKLRSLAIDADRGVPELEEKLEDILDRLREKYKQRRLSADTVEEIKSLKARIENIIRQMKQGKLKPKSKPNPQDNLTYCNICGSKAVKVLNRKDGRKRNHCSVCGNSKFLNPLFRTANRHRFG